MTRFIVCGGRNYGDREEIARVLTKVPDDWILVHGAATGVDTLAGEAWPGLTEPHPADWNQFGAAAGPIRNGQMLTRDVALVVAFPGGAGTRDMVRRAKRANVEVWEIQ